MSDAAIGNQKTVAQLGQALFTLTPFGPRFGAEIKGLDLSRPIPEDVAVAVRAALAQHKLLCLRNNVGVGPAELYRFSCVFGDPEKAEHPSHPDHPDQPGVKVLRSDIPVGRRLVDSWHTDGATRESTRCVSVLQAVDVPEVGRDTAFADMEAIYDDLSADMKAFLEGKTALHSWGMQKPDAPPVEHPVIMINPANGRRALYVNKLYTRSIIGLRQDENDALLNLFFGLPHFPEYQARVRWAPGDIAIWDNELTQHYLVYDKAYSRVMHRCMMF